MCGEDYISHHLWRGQVSCQRIKTVAGLLAVRRGVLQLESKRL